MGRSTSTKTSIFEAFKQCLASAPFQSVSVQDVTDACSLCRRSFYYHFSDFNELVKWGFRHELALAIKGTCPTKSLVYPAEWMEDPLADMPYYARTVAGIRSLNCSGFFTAFHTYLDENRAFYKAVMTSPIAGSFMRYLEWLYVPAFYRDVKTIAGGRNMPEEDAAKIARCFAYVSVIDCFPRIAFSNYPMADSMPQGLQNSVHDSLYAVVNMYFASNETPYKIANTSVHS